VATVACFTCSSAALAQLDDHLWIGGTGNQQWQVNTNWDLVDDETDEFPNDPGRVDGAPAVIVNSEGANVSVNLAANLNLDVGATNVTVASLTMGGTAGAVTTNIIAFVKDLGSNGLVGLIALGFILWLFSHRSMA